MTLAQYHWDRCGVIPVFHSMRWGLQSHNIPGLSPLSSPEGGESGEGGFVKRTRPVKPNTFLSFSSWEQATCCSLWQVSQRQVPEGSP